MSRAYGAAVWRVRARGWWSYRVVLTPVAAPAALDLLISALSVMHNAAGAGSPLVN